VARGTCYNKRLPKVFLWISGVWQVAEPMHPTDREEWI
jgi:hypothetical protein